MRPDWTFQNGWAGSPSRRKGAGVSHLSRLTLVMALCTCLSDQEASAQPAGPKRVTATATLR
jgi:hypothetical protein